MSNQVKSDRAPVIEEFCRNLARLDDGDRARLKRSAGKALAESRQVQLMFFQRVLPRAITSDSLADRYFLLATLYPFDKEQRKRDRATGARNNNPDDNAPGDTISAASGRSLGATIRLARSDGNSAGFDRRFARLLDADSQQLPFQLRQAVRLLAASGKHIDWPQLTRDVLAWDHPDRYVQRRWARDYVAYEPEAQ